MPKAFHSRLALLSCFDAGWILDTGATSRRGNLCARPGGAPDLKPTLPIKPSNQRHWREGREVGEERQRAADVLALWRRPFIQAPSFWTPWWLRRAWSISWGEGGGGLGGGSVAREHPASAHRVDANREK